MEGWCVMLLPDRPNLEYLKKLAKEKLRELQRGDASARLADAQLAVAREHGFASWRKLRAHLDALRRAGVAPDLYCAAGLGDAKAVEAFFDAEGRLQEGASSTGSSRYGPDGMRLPCPPPSAREVVSDALYIACRNGKEEAVRVLLRHGPDLSFRAFAGGTPLHWAYFSGSRAVIEALLQAGADPTLRDGVLRCTPKTFGICWPASEGWVSKVRQRLADDPTLVN